MRSCGLDIRSTIKARENQEMKKKNRIAYSQVMIISQEVCVIIFLKCLICSNVARDTGVSCWMHCGNVSCYTHTHTHLRAKFFTREQLSSTSIKKEARRNRFIAKSCALECSACWLMCSRTFHIYLLCALPGSRNYQCWELGANASLLRTTGVTSRSIRFFYCTALWIFIITDVS